MGRRDPVSRSSLRGIREQDRIFVFVVGADQDDDVVPNGHVGGVRVPGALRKHLAAERVVAGGTELDDEVAERGGGEERESRPSTAEFPGAIVTVTRQEPWSPPVAWG